MALNETALRAFLDKHRKEQKAAYDGDGTLFYNFPRDTSQVVVQFLPPVHGSHTFGRYIYQHWVNAGSYKAIFCFKTYELDCPMCNMLEPYQGRLDLTPWAYQVQSKTHALILKDATYESRYKKALDPKLPHVVTGNGYALLDWLTKTVMKCFEKDAMLPDFTNPDNSFPWIFQRKKKDGAFDKQMVPMPRKIGDNLEERAIILGKAADFSKLYKNPDDVYLNKMRESVILVKDIIENKIMTLSSPDGQFAEAMNNPAAMQDNSYQESYSQAPLAMDMHQPPVAVLGPPAPSAPLPPVQSVPLPGPQAMGSGQRRPIPPGAPQCFGDKHVYNDQNEKCNICMAEYQCQQVVQQQA